MDSYKSIKNLHAFIIGILPAYIRYKLVGNWNARSRVLCGASGGGWAGADQMHLRKGSRKMSESAVLKEHVRSWAASL